MGAAHDAAIREQIDLALEAERKLIFYLTRGHESATGAQKQLIEDIRENRWNLPVGSWALLQSRSPAVLRQDLIVSLAPAKPAPTSANAQATRVYLLCDPSSEDATFAQEIQGRIRERERFEVELPQVAANSGSQHERLLGECDGLLLYHEKAPQRWYQRNFADLLTAEDRARQRELRSKALLVNGANLGIPGLTVIQRQDPFNLEQLEPFLAPLRGGEAEGVAHAGG